MQKSLTLKTRQSRMFSSLGCILVEDVRLICFNCISDFFLCNSPASCCTGDFSLPLPSALASSWSFHTALFVTSSWMGLLLADFFLGLPLELVALCSGFPSLFSPSTFNRCLVLTAPMPSQSNLYKHHHHFTILKEPCMPNITRMYPRHVLWVFQSTVLTHWFFAYL